MKKNKKYYGEIDEERVQESVKNIVKGYNKESKYKCATLEWNIENCKWYIRRAKRRIKRGEMGDNYNILEAYERALAIFEASA